MRLIDANAIEMVMNERYDALVVEYGHYDHYTTGYGDALCVVEDAPTIDAVEVVHANWIEDGYYGNPFVCSHCGSEGCYSGDFNNKQYYYTNYCPSCGADMRERKDDA